MSERLLERIRLDRPARRRVVPQLRPDREWLPYVAVFAGALLLRALSLGERPMHHDESIHAWLTWRLYGGEGYEYDPAYHGPLQFYLYTLGSFALGAGDIAMRSVPVLLGACMALLPWFLRDQLGRLAALSASVLLAVSPSFLYFSRFAREDTIVVALTLALVVLTFRFLDRPGRWYPAAILGVLAACFATKETTYITAFVGGTFFALALVLQLVRARRRGRPLRSAPLVAAVRAPGLEAWIWGLTSFALVFTLLFSTFLLHPQGLRDGLYDSIEYWLSQQPVNRGGQPWFYYLVVMPLYELPILALGLVGVVTSLRRPTLLRVFLVYDFALSLAVYSWAGERMPWLVVHPLLPVVLLAGIGVQTVWSNRRRPVRVAALVAAPVMALVLVHGATAVAYDHPADPSELLVQVQTSTDVPPVRDQLVALDRRVVAATGDHPRIAVDAWGGTGWPWSWYLRDLPVAYVDMSGPLSPGEWDVVLVAEPNADRVLPRLRGFAGYRFHLREWWDADYGAASPRALWRWFWRRQAWSPKATMDEYVYVRAGLPGLPGALPPATASG